MFLGNFASEHVSANEGGVGGDYIFLTPLPEECKRRLSLHIPGHLETPLVMEVVLFLGKAGI